MRSSSVLNNVEIHPDKPLGTDQLDAFRWTLELLERCAHYALFTEDAARHPFPDSEQQRQARICFDHLLSVHNGCISPQAIKELVAACTAIAQGKGPTITEPKRIVAIINLYCEAADDPQLSF